jgi:ketosteroid isomerase-like protein
MSTETVSVALTGRSHPPSERGSAYRYQSPADALDEGKLGTKTSRLGRAIPARRDNGRAMSQEPTTSGLVELLRSLIEPANRRDFHAMVSIYAPDAVFDTSPWEMGTYEGPAAIRRLFENWIDAFEDFEIEAEEVLDLGNGVVFAVLRQSVRPFGGSEHVPLRAAWVYEWAAGMVVRVTTYRDIDEARAAAERLAEERG